MILTYDASMVKGNQGYQNLEANKLLCASTESKKIQQKYNKNRKLIPARRVHSILLCKQL